MSADIDRVRRVKDQLRQRLCDDPGLRGIGIAAGVGTPAGYAVVVRVAAPATADRLALPATIEGVPVRVTVVGDVSVRPHAAPLMPGAGDPGAAGRMGGL